MGTIDMIYWGAKNLLYPLFCLIVGIPMIGSMIFLQLSRCQVMSTIVLSGIGFCLGILERNPSGVYEPTPIYFNGIRIRD